MSGTFSALTIWLMQITAANESLTGHPVLVDTRHSSNVTDRNGQEFMQTHPSFKRVWSCP